MKKHKFGKMEVWKNGNLKKWKFGKMEIWKNTKGLSYFAALEDEFRKIQITRQ